jgi:hypothetical protein
MHNNDSPDERSSDRFDDREALTHDSSELNENRQFRKRPGKPDHRGLPPIEAMMADGGVPTPFETTDAELNTDARAQLAATLATDAAAASPSTYQEVTADGDA